MVVVPIDVFLRLVQDSLAFRKTGPLPPVNPSVDPELMARAQAYASQLGADFTASLDILEPRRDELADTEESDS